MVGMGLENRIQINRGHAQLGNIRQLLRNAFQVAAEIIVVPKAVHLGLVPKRLLPPVTPHPGGRHTGLWRAGIVKPIRKDLIDQSTPQKGRRLKILIIYRLLKIRTVRQKIPFAAPGVAHKMQSPWGVQFKMIKIQPRGGGGKMQLPILCLRAAHPGPKHTVRHRRFAVLGDHQPGAGAMHIPRDHQPQMHRLIRCHGADGRLVLWVSGVEDQHIFPLLNSKKRQTQALPCACRKQIYFFLVVFFVADFLAADFWAAGFFAGFSAGFSAAAAAF